MLYFFCKDFPYKHGVTNAKRVWKKQKPNMNKSKYFEIKREKNKNM